MKKLLLLIVGIAVVTSTTGALAQHENMPGHEKMPPGEHGKHNKNKKGGDADKTRNSDTERKKNGDADKAPPPKSGNDKHEGHDQP